MKEERIELGRCLNITVCGQTPKTYRWEVRSRRNDAMLGMIGYYSRWRAYVFYPNQATILNGECLIDLATFLRDAPKVGD